MTEEQIVTKNKSNKSLLDLPELDANQLHVEWKKTERVSVNMMQNHVFYASLSRMVTKVNDNKRIPTAAVAYNKETDDIVMLVNTCWTSTLTEKQIETMFMHEYGHMFGGHITGRFRKPQNIWNIATDLALNSMLYEMRMAEHNNNIQQSIESFWPGALIPGHFPWYPDKTALEKASDNLKQDIEFIAKLPHGKSSEWYFDTLIQYCEENGRNTDGDAGNAGTGMTSADFGGTGDNHDMWKDIPDVLKEYVEQKIKNMVESAAKNADKSSNGWGNMPAHHREMIRKYCSQCIDWKRVLANFIGTIARGNRTSSIKRINRRYPLIHPGTKRNYLPKLLVALDDSGSVSIKATELFFATLGELTKKVDISIVHFDTECGEPKEWKRGQPWKSTRERCGGTDFDAPTNLANNPKNRGRWDGVLIMTDGVCNKPGSSRLRRGWVIEPGSKLNFTTDELVIEPSTDSTIHDAWL